MVMKLEFRIESRVWLSRFTRRHPELVVQALSLMAAPNDTVLAEYDIIGPPQDWTKEIASFPDVVDVERLGVLPDLGRYRVRYLATQVFALHRKFELLIRYPASAQDGTGTNLLVGRRSHLRRLVSALRRAGNTPRLLSLDRYSLRSTSEPRVVTLTPIQRALFRQALATGYFDVPRGITLTQLAEKVSRSKSSVSHTLAIVERKLAETALGTPN